MTQEATTDVPLIQNWLFTIMCITLDLTLICWQAKWAGMKGTLRKQAAEYEWLVTDARAPNRFLSTEKNSLDKAIDRLAKLGQDIPQLIEEKQKLEPLVKGHLDSLQKLEIEIETLREEETEVRSCS